MIDLHKVMKCPGPDCLVYICGFCFDNIGTEGDEQTREAAAHAHVDTHGRGYFGEVGRRPGETPEIELEKAKNMKRLKKFKKYFQESNTQSKEEDRDLVLNLMDEMNSNLVDGVEFNLGGMVLNLVDGDHGERKM